MSELGIRVAQKDDDVWLHTVCDMCYSYCGILAHRVDGTVVKIEGDPACPHNWGRLCAKGHAGVIGLYDPSRVTTPLRRTNPEKRIGADPKWEPISWDEALEILTAKLRAVREDDPRKLVISSFDVPVLDSLLPFWSSAFGTPNNFWVGYYCGNYLHSSMYLTNGTFHSDFDIDHCNYVMLLGNQAGFMVGLNPNLMTQKMADSRMRGMRVVVVDPICTNAASKADEWVPIRPGTDGALMLGMVNVLLNELGIYDAEFIKRHTNGSYLVKGDGYYVRDRDGKPMVWDEGAGCAKSHDAEIKDAALDGSFPMNGGVCRPAFSLLKEHVKGYTPEKVSEITTIPAETVRRLAREFGEAARIGSTITIDGVELPYRPVAVNIYRGAGAHKHGVHVALAMQILNMIVGAFYVPGGHRGANLVGPEWSWAPGEADGLIVPPHTIGHGANYYAYDIKPPQTLGLYELFPLSTNRSPMYQLASLDPDRFGLPYQPEVLIVCRRNLFLSNASQESCAETLRKFSFVAVFATHLDEVAEFADLVLPEAHYLEKLELFPNPVWLSVSTASGYLYWGIRQPVVEPAGQARSWSDVLMELADRLGFRGNLYRVMNAGLGFKEPHLLEPEKRYSREEIYDRWAKSKFGPDHGLDWFKEHGYLAVERSVDELYPLTFLRVRFPLYFENVKRAGEDLKSETSRMGLDWWDTRDYQPLPDWTPCPAFGSNGENLYAVNYRIPTHNQSVTSQNPWLQEVAQTKPYAQKVMINTETARRLGIKDGEKIWVESEVDRVLGEAKVTECIHPEVVGICGHFGSWAKGKPIAKGKGTSFNALVPIDIEHIDWISAGVDACVRVKLHRAGEGARQ